MTQFILHSQSISLDNTKPYPYYIIGYCYYSCELYTDAINYFNQALSVDPNYINARKAIKTARTLAIISAISQTLTAVSNGLNSAYNSSANYGGSSSYSTSRGSLSTVSSSGGMHRKACKYCNGSGVCSDPTYGPTFGLDRAIMKEACRICGRYESHYHKSCIPCHGKGVIESY